MKKYTRLALFSVALFSVITMLVYKYKYHNLQSVIDVINFFPAKATKNSACLTKQPNYNITAEITLSSNHWTELFDGIHIYSPHVMNSYVFFLAYSKNVTAVNLLKSITCHVWLENEEKSLKSKLVVHYLNEKNTSHFYFECQYTFDLGIPNAVIFMKDGVSVTIPVYHKQLYTGQYAACVNPSLNHFSDLHQIIEFLIYHSHIGIKHFLLYYTAFSNSVKEVLVNVANECDIIIEFLPWITPPQYDNYNLKLQPYFIDCIFHISSLNHSNFVFLLDLNQFVVFEETKSIKKLVHDNIFFDYIQMEKRMFCLNYPNNFIAEELNINFKTLLKTKMSRYAGQKMNAIYDVKHLMSNINQISDGFKTWLITEKLQTYKTIKSSSASIYSYIDCGSQNFSDISYLEDKKMWSFKQILFDSCIYKHAVSILGKDL